MSDQISKQCKRCNETKLIDCFGKDKSKKDEKRIYCKECAIDLNRENHKLITFSNWSRQGIRFEHYEQFEKVYDIYINTNKCYLCPNVFKNDKDRKLDHFHKPIVNNYRWICCNRCNLQVAVTERIKNEFFVKLQRYYFTNILK